MTGWEGWYRRPEAATQPERAVPTEPQPALPGMPADAVRSFPALGDGCRDDAYAHMAADPYGIWMTAGPDREYAGPGAHARPPAPAAPGPRWPARMALAVSALALAASAYPYLSPPPVRPLPARPASVCVHVDRRTGFVRALTRPPCTGSSRTFRIP